MLSSRRFGRPQVSVGAPRHNVKLCGRKNLITRATSEKYDYIIVGGGAAGCVLANRLTADGTKSVLLLEAGPDNKNFWISVPVGILKLFRSKLDWNLLTPPNQLLKDREIYVARGKVLGGSSSTNATLYHRGIAADYDNWDIQGWGSEDVLKYYKMCEDNPAFGDTPYHGVGGPMRVEDVRYECKVHQMFLEAAGNAGLPFNNDFNDWSKSQLGYGTFQVTQERGVRADMFRQYLKPVLGRPNLHVSHSSLATKVAFDGTRAVGVAFDKEGSSQSAEVTADGEVLLCGGAVHSPHLLQLSGIGPESMLSEHGIPVLSDLPAVGTNLQDHPSVVRTYDLKPEFQDQNYTATDELFNKTGRLRLTPILKYALLKRGPLCSTGCDRGAFISTDGGDVADVQLRMSPGPALSPDGVQAYVELGAMREKGMKPPSAITLQVIACRPKSRGSVGLKSSNPLEDPLIDIGFLSDPADIATLKKGLSVAKDIAAANPLGDLLGWERFPGDGVSSEEDLEDYIRGSVHSANAVVGTCRMGTDQQAVVTPDLKVRGVRNLRVIDASVIPVMPGGQTCAPTVMIAEKASAMLLATEPKDTGDEVDASNPVLA